MFKEKYLKYKTKYLDLKSQIGGYEIWEVADYSPNSLYITRKDYAYGRFSNYYRLKIDYKNKNISFYFPDVNAKELDIARNYENYKHVIWSEERPDFYNKVFQTEKDKQIIMRPFFVKADELIRTYLDRLPTQSREGMTKDQFKQYVETEQTKKTMYLTAIAELLWAYDHT